MLWYVLEVMILREKDRRIEKVIYKEVDLK